MSLLRNIVSGLRSLFRKEQVSSELDEELDGFLEMAVQEEIKQGMSRKEALREVCLERGSLEITKEVIRSASWDFSRRPSPRNHRCHAARVSFSRSRRSTLGAVGADPG